MGRNLGIKIAVAGILSFIALCTWSDYYYSKLKRDYTVLRDFNNIRGYITDLLVRGTYSYVTIDSIERFLILPTKAGRLDSQEFSELVEVGDLIYKDGKSDEIYLQKHGAVYEFRNNEGH
jgi:hypothetical protein